MPKGVKKRGGPKFSNRRNKQSYLKKREDKKSQSKSSIKLIKEAWNPEKTTRENVRDMGLAFNPNDAVGMPNRKRDIIDAAPIAGEVPHVAKKVKRVSGKAKDFELAQSTIKKLEEEYQEKPKNPEDRAGFQLYSRDTELCVYMSARHGDDFQAMTRDPKNLWQYTPKQWQKRINAYKNTMLSEILR